MFYDYLTLSSISVRRAVVDDAGGILACLAEAFAPFRDDYAAAAFADTTLDGDSIHERLRSMTVFVAVEADFVIGTIACGVLENGDGHLRGMAVVPKRQGCGVARMLIEAAERELAARGVRRITLDTTAPLARAARFYASCGYRRTGATTDFFGMPLIEFEKILAPVQR
ncbi:MAG TPA: GNAT family N-acetyltransferase [Thermoanaerobaculia bacterium]|nr:GNAT family N-acetyltransferase [Thermoanaerobaculia bacterium]